MRHKDHELESESTFIIYYVLITYSIIYLSEPYGCMVCLACILRGLTKAAPKIGWLPLLHSSKVSLKAGPRPLTVAFRLKDADDAVEVEVAPCTRSVMQSHPAARQMGAATREGLVGKGNGHTAARKTKAG